MAVHSSLHSTNQPLLSPLSSPDTPRVSTPKTKYLVDRLQREWDIAYHFTTDSRLEALVKKYRTPWSSVALNFFLQRAVTAGHSSIVPSLLSAKADPNYQDCQQKSILESAFEQLPQKVTLAHLNTIDLLLRAGANPNQPFTSNFLPLTKAVIFTSDHLVQSLLEFRADPTLTDPRGHSAIDAAELQDIGDENTTSTTILHRLQEASLEHVEPKEEPSEKKSLPTGQPKRHVTKVKLSKKGSSLSPDTSLMKVPSLLFPLVSSAQGTLCIHRTTHNSLGSSAVTNKDKESQATSSLKKPEAVALSTPRKTRVVRLIRRTSQKIPTRVGSTSITDSVLKIEENRSPL